MVKPVWIARNPSAYSGCRRCDLACIRACPGTVPFLHPGDNKATICNLCDGEPKCVEVCTEAGYNALTITNEEPSIHRKLYSRYPVEVARDLAIKFFGEKGEEVIE